MTKARGLEASEQGRKGVRPPLGISDAAAREVGRILVEWPELRNRLAEIDKWGEPSRLSKQDAQTLDRLWIKYPTLIDYVRDRSYQFGYETGKSVGAALEKKESNRQRRGRSVTKLKIGAPSKYNEAVLSMSQRAVDARAKGVTKEAAISDLVDRLLNYEDGFAFPELQNLRGPLGRDGRLSLLAILRRRAARNE